MTDDTQDTVEKIFTVKGLRKRVKKKFDVTTEVSSKIREADAEDRAMAYIKDGSLIDVDIIEDKDDLIDAFKKEKDGDSSPSVKVESDSLANGGEPPKPSVEKPPTAAEVVGHWNDPQKTKTTVYGAHNLEKGDELVRRQDHEEAVQEARRRERQRILEIVNSMNASLQSGVRFKHMIIDELRGEVENQGLSKQNTQTEDKTQW